MSKAQVIRGSEIFSASGKRRPKARVERAARKRENEVDFILIWQKRLLIKGAEKAVEKQ